MRVKRGTNRRDRRRKILARAKGYYLSKHNCYRIAKLQVDRSLLFAYAGRKAEEAPLRALWITRIGAAARENGISYSRLMNGLKRAGIELDRRVLADLALTQPQAFTDLVGKARAALA